MARQNDSVWSSANTLLETGLELYGLIKPRTGEKGADKGGKVEQIADGVLLISNDKDVLLAVRQDTALPALSETAAAYGEKKGEYLCYAGAMTAIPLYELSRVKEGVREHIISEESLRATLCGNYPEYVKTHNMTASPDARIEDADAPPYLFLQHQLDNAVDATNGEVIAFQESRGRGTETDNGLADDVLELER